METYFDKPLDKDIAELEATISQLNTGVYVVTLDAVTNTSGSYTHTTTVNGMTGDLKAVKLECSDPTIFRAPVSIVSGSNSVTLTCSSVAGSSTVKASFLAVGNGNPLNSSEYSALDQRIGQLADLETTDKTDVVSAINEVNGRIINASPTFDLNISANSTQEVTISRGNYTRSAGYSLLAYNPLISNATYALVTLKEATDTTLVFIVRNLNTSSNIVATGNYMLISYIK